MRPTRFVFICAAATTVSIAPDGPVRCICGSSRSGGEKHLSSPRRALGDVGRFRRVHRHASQSGRALDVIRSPWPRHRGWSRATSAPGQCGSRRHGIRPISARWSAPASRHTTYGFRAAPAAKEQTLRGGGPSAQSSGKIEYDGTFRRPASALGFDLRTALSGVEQVNFFGFGNDTPSRRRSRYHIQQTLLTLAPAVRIGSAARASLAIGPELRYSDSGKRTGDNPLRSRRRMASADSAWSICARRSRPARGRMRAPH